MPIEEEEEEEEEEEDVKTYGGKVVKSHAILTRRWEVSFKPRPLCPLFPLRWWTDGSKSRSARFGNDKKKSFATGRNHTTIARPSSSRSSHCLAKRCDLRGDQMRPVLDAVEWQWRAIDRHVCSLIYTNHALLWHVRFCRQLVKLVSLFFLKWTDGVRRDRTPDAVCRIHYLKLLH